MIIEYEYKPALMIHKDTFKKATRELKEIVPDGFKAAVNCMIGLLGEKIHKKVNSFMTSLLVGRHSVTSLTATSRVRQLFP